DRVQHRRVLATDRAGAARVLYPRLREPQAEHPVRIDGGTRGNTRVRGKAGALSEGSSSVDDDVVGLGARASNFLSARFEERPEGDLLGLGFGHVVKPFSARQLPQRSVPSLTDARAPGRSTPGEACG